LNLISKKKPPAKAVARENRFSRIYKALASRFNSALLITVSNRANIVNNKKYDF